MRKLVLFALLVATGLSFVNCSDDETINETESLTSVEREDLLRLREEEKLARDVYLYAYDTYGLSISNNISQSEQMHMDEILDLLNKYGLDDPALPNRGEFSNQTLQTLYDDLTAQVDVSELDAIVVGATIEDLDIYDIEEFESHTNKNDILDAYSKLKCGSRNHMRAYYADLISRGYTYEAQFITANELSDIVNSDRERCGNN